MSFKKYGPSRNLFDASNFALIQVTSTAYRYGTSLGVLSQGTYTFNATKSAGAQSIYLTAKLNGVYSQTIISSVPFSFTADGNSEYIIRTANNTGTTWEAENYSNMMLNLGSTPLPYEPYGNIWQTINPKQLKGIPYTGTLPATLSGTKAGYLHKYKVYGNLTQNGTPTPENPIVPSECGELETTGVHAGQYKLPLTSAGQDVDIYLGESQTTRQIKKLVLTGDEIWSYESSVGRFGAFIANFKSLGVRLTPFVTDRYVVVDDGRAIANVPDNAAYTGAASTTQDGTYLYIHTSDYSSTNDFKTYLAQQYANGTPVTVWCILTTPTTGTLNEPLRKIGDYADTLDSTQTSAQIPTTAGSTTISWAGSGLAPSQFDSIQEWVDISTYKRVNGEWVADN